MIQESRLYRIAQRIYDHTIRPHLPTVYTDASGIAIPTRILDISRWYPNRMRYKAEGIDAIREYVEPGDRVIEVGTGRGVFAACAANMSGNTVVSFDGSAAMLDRTREFHRTIGMSDSVILDHAIVGDPINVYDEPEGAAVLSPGELPEGDVLIMDCEGAEISILEGVSWTPRCVIIETHPDFGATTPRVEECVRALGLDVVATDHMQLEKHVVTGGREA